jgi:hypothetical protein
LTPVSLSSDWESLLTDHQAAVQQFIEAARRCERPAWMRPLAPGKWSPAEVTSHVAEAYQVLRSELSGGAGMRLLGSPLQRWLLRHTILPRLCQGKPFPPGVRAPRETRPREIEEDPALAVTSLGTLAMTFTKELTNRAAAGKVRLTHAYFGPLSARQGLQLLIVHTRHHARQLAAAVV